MSNFIMLALNVDQQREFNLMESLYPSHVKCNGVYKGVAERSYMIEFHDRSDIKFAELLAERFNQESILVCANGSCYLSYIKSGHKLPIGKWTNVTQDEAYSEDAYTEINGKYYICKGE